MCREVAIASVFYEFLKFAPFYSIYWIIQKNE